MFKVALTNFLEFSEIKNCEGVLCGIEKRSSLKSSKNTNLVIKIIPKQIRQYQETQSRGHLGMLNDFSQDKTHTASQKGKF